MTRVFPGLMALPIVFGAVVGLIRGRRDGKQMRFTLVFCGACALLLVASHTTGRGASTWPEWAEKISIHSEHHPRTGSKRVGLGRLALHFPRADRFWRVPRPLSADQEARAHTRKVVITALGLALLLVALRGRDDLDAMLLMLFAAWLATTSSRYYASIWLLYFTLPTHGARAGPGRFAGLGLMVMLAAYYAPPSTTGRYLALNYEALAMFVGLCLVYALGDRRARSRGLADAPEVQPPGPSVGLADAPDSQPPGPSPRLADAPEAP